MSEGTIYKTLVVEDEEIILHNIIQKIEKTNPQFKVIGSAFDGKEALELIDAMCPDVLFTDIRMPIMDGLELIRQVVDRHPDIQIVILSGYDEFEYARQAIRYGVKSYLLKPLKLDALEETLKNISCNLQAKINSNERAILSSELMGRPHQTNLPYSFDQDHFSLYLIGIGSLCNHLTSPEQLKFFLDAWDRIDLPGILGSIFKDNEKWWLVDEKPVNQKFLVIGRQQNSTDDIVSTAAKIQESIFDLINPVNVTICTVPSAITYKEIWSLAQRLRISFEQGLVIGKNQVLTPEEAERRNQTPALLDALTQNKLIALVQTGNIPLVRHEVSILLKKWKEANYTQHCIQKLVHQLLKLIQRQITFLSEAELNHIEYRIFGQLAVSVDLSPIFDMLCLFIDGLISPDTKETDDIMGVLDMVEDYIHAHYTEQISIEDLSRKFCFNPSYLTRMFKKHKGETPLKLIINLRIAEAKRLVQKQRDLDIKEIGEIIGYPDQHYFCRIFKNMTGMSPSEFRETLIS